MDIADHAQQSEELHLNHALSQIKKATGESLEDCEDCGEPIPALRRETLKGCRTCVYCQEIREQRQRRYR